jgi:integrase
VTYGGEQINLVFTNPTGGLVLRQAVTKVVKQAAKTAGIAADLGTHAGRRTVVTTLFVDGDEALEDIARFVGHAKPATTAGYVKRLGRRPEAVARRAASVLDGQDDDEPAEDRVRNQPGDFGSNGGSYRSGTAGSPPDADGP